MSPKVVCIIIFIPSVAMRELYEFLKLEFSMKSKVVVPADVLNSPLWGFWLVTLRGGGN